jgi:hypothetical protein
MTEHRPLDSLPLINEFVALIEASTPWSSHLAHAVLDEIGGLPPGMPELGSEDMPDYLDQLVPAMRRRLDQICDEGANPAFIVRALVHHLDALLDRRLALARIMERNRWAVDLLHQWADDPDAAAILVGTGALNAPAQRLILSRMFVDPVSERWATADNYFSARRHLTDEQIDSMDRTRDRGQDG